jgi:hypothetical protein
MLEIGASGSVGGEGGNILVYPANLPYGILGGTMETSASFEARSAPSSYPTIPDVLSGSACQKSGLPAWGNSASAPEVFM